MKRPYYERLTRYFGRRGGILFMFGICWVFLGYGFASQQVDRFSRPGPGGPLEFMDSVPFPGLFWVVCGLIALVNAVTRRRFGNEDAYGFAAVVMPPLLWVFAYSTSWLQWLLTHGSGDETYGQSDSYLGALTFLVIVIIIRITANWTDDLDVQAVVEKKLTSKELALLDRMTETKPENDARGDRAREESELWIKHARIETEQRIAASAAENDRMIQAVEDEREIGRANNENRDRE